MSLIRTSLFAALVAGLPVGSAIAQVTVVSVVRNISAHACINVPPDHSNQCGSTNDSNSTAGPWLATGSFGPSASNDTGYATAYYILSQQSDIKPNQLVVSGRTNAYAASGGTCTGESAAASLFSVVFDITQRTKVTVYGDNTGSASSYYVELGLDGGSGIFSTNGGHDAIEIGLQPGRYTYTATASAVASCSDLCENDFNGIWEAEADFVLSPCDADLNGDNVVEDADFVIFAFAYNELLCPDAPAICPADLNGDGSVDDSDFVLFVAAYNTLLCP